MNICAIGTKLATYSIIHMFSWQSKVEIFQKINGCLLYVGQMNSKISNINIQAVEQMISHVYHFNIPWYTILAQLRESALASLSISDHESALLLSLLTKPISLRDILLKFIELILVIRLSSVD